MSLVVERLVEHVDELGSVLVGQLGDLLDILLFSLGKET